MTTTDTKLIFFLSVFLLTFTVGVSANALWSLFILPPSHEEYDRAGKGRGC